MNVTSNSNICQAPSCGVTIALECSAWEKMGVTPIAFMPQSYIEGPLHGLADGGSLATLVPGNVAYIGGRGLHSSIFQLKLSALCGTGGARRGCVAHVKGVSGGVQGV
jgi:hypothetical protein